MNEKRVELPKGYEQTVEKILARVDPRQQEEIARTLMNEKAVESYSLMQDSGLPRKSIERVMTHGIKNLARGRKISIGQYTSALAEDLVKMEGYEDVIDDMREEEIIDDKQYHNLRETVHGQKHARINHHRSQLEEYASRPYKAAAAIFVFFGALFLLLTQPNLTGAVIGGTIRNPGTTFTIGFGLIVVGLAILLVGENRKKF